MRKQVFISGTAENRKRERLRVRRVGLGQKKDNCAKSFVSTGPRLSAR
jgi:hypothetical protein